MDCYDNHEWTLLGYKVHRSTSATGTFVKGTTPPVTGSRYTDATAVVGITYHYRVTALSSYGAESGNSTVASAVRTADTVPRGVPAGLGATGESGGIRLGWTSPGDADIAGYRIYRALSADGPWSLLNPTGLITATSYLDTANAPAQVWFYKVSGVDASGNESPQSDAASAERLGTGLPPAVRNGL